MSLTRRSWSGVRFGRVWQGWVAMELRVLGPMEVYINGAVAELTGARRRALVAMLGVRPGQALSREEIAEALWDGRPPPSAASTVKGYVSKIRTVLGDDALRTTPAGYAFQLARPDVDATRFEDAVRRSMTATAADATRVAADLGDALSLWRGAALSEFRDAAWARAEASRLDNMHETALERWVDVRLELGEHLALVP